MCNKREYWLWTVGLSNGSQQYVVAETAKQVTEIIDTQLNGVRVYTLSRNSKILM